MAHRYKKVVCFLRDGNTFAQARMDEFSRGCFHHGIDVQFSDIFTRVNCDLAVMWSANLKDIQMMQKQQGRDYLILEIGYFGPREELISFNFNGLNGKADHRIDEKCPDDRWLKFGLDLKPYHNGGEYYLITGQIPFDNSCRNVDVRAFWQNTANWLHGIAMKPVYFRSHPKREPLPAPLYTRPLNAGTIDKALEKAHLCLTYNSNSAVDALIAGVPVMVKDPGSMAYPLSNPFEENNLFFPNKPAREQWAHNLAYTQWTRSEVSSGEAWEYLCRD